MSQHTPGPWHVVRERDGGGWKGIGVQDAERLFVATMVMQPGDENEIANAKLIAAAPELVDALREIEDLIQGYVDSVDGPDGQPAPNKAMQASMLIEKTLHKAGVA